MHGSIPSAFLITGGDENKRGTKNDASSQHGVRALFYSDKVSQGGQDVPAGMSTDVYIRRQSRCAPLRGRHY